MLKKLTRGLALLLVLCMAVSLLPLGAAAAEVTAQQGTVTEEVADPAAEETEETSDPAAEETEETSDPAAEETEETADPAAEEEIAVAAEDEISTASITMGTKPADGTTTDQPFASGTGGSSNFRIPAMVTLSDGTIVAATDARWNHTSDAYGLDTIVSVSSDGGETWSYTFANYLGDNGNTYNTSSTAFIDPALAVDGDDTIYMLVDLYPTGGVINGISAGTGYNSDGYLKLSTTGNSSSDTYGYYLKDGKIYSNDGTEVSGLTVDAYFNLTGTYNGTTYDTNLFFSDSPFKVLKTSYLYLTTSTDGGKTWSAPTMLNAQVKSDSEYFYGVGPGRGLVTSTGRIIFSCYTYANGSDGNTSVIYSDDGGVTWTRSASMSAQSSEATMVEADGSIYMFTRHGGYYVSTDNGTTWGSKQSMGISYTETCQLNAITYSKKIDGKTAILLSAPTNGRTTGKIFVGLVQDDGSISWNYTYSVNGSSYYAYSCLTELSDGTVALLYESSSGGETFTTLSIETIASGATIGSPTTLTNTDATEGTITVAFTEEVESMTVTTATVDGMTDTYVAYDIVPGTGYNATEATVTLPLTAELQACATLYGFYVDENGTITKVSGTKSADGATYTFTVPHFTVVGVAGSTAAVTVDQTIELVVGESTTVTDETGNYANDAYTNTDSSVASVTMTGTDAQEGGTETTYTQVSTPSWNGLTSSNGTYQSTSYYYLVNGSYYPVYVSRSNGSGGRTSYTLYYYNGSYQTITSYNGRFPSFSYPSATLYTATTTTIDPVEASTTINFTGTAEGTTYVTIGSTTYEVVVKYNEETLNTYVGGSVTATVSGDITTDPNTSIATASVSGTTMTVTGVAVGTTTLIAGSTRYTVIVSEAPDYVTTDDSPFTADSNRQGSSGVITKLYLSTGLTYDVNLASGVATGGTWAIEDTSIATVDSSTGAVTGVSVGETVLSYTDPSGNVYRMPVVIVNYGTSATTGIKTYDFYITEVTNTTAYMGVLYGTNNSSVTAYDLEEVQAGEAIYISFASNAATAVDFFGDPDEGYALTYMAATNAAGHYMALNSTAPASTDFYTKSGAAGANQASAFGGTVVQAMIQKALDADCDGGMGWTRASGNTDSATSTLTFRSQKLPTVEKTIVSVGDEAYTEGMSAKAGDVITYNVTITQYATTEAITYTNVTLTDNLDGATFTDNSSNTMTVSSLSNSTLASDTTYTYTVTYTIQDSDLETTITNTVDLDYTYQAQYSSGSFGGSANAEAKITATAFPGIEDIVVDFGLPVTTARTVSWGTGTLTITGTAKYGTVTVDGDNTNGIAVTYTPTQALEGVDTVTLTNNLGGTYTFNVYPASTVYYEENFATYGYSWDISDSDAWTESTFAASQTATPASTDDQYGYDAAYSSQTTNVGTATTSTKGDTLSFSFTGTGVDIYAGANKYSATVMIWVTDASGSSEKLITVNTASIDGTTADTQYEGNYYNVPIASITGLTHGTHTVKIQVMSDAQFIFDGFRVYGTLTDESETNTVYADDWEDDPSFIEVRNLALASVNLSDYDGEYGTGTAIVEQVYSAISSTEAKAAILNGNTSYTAADLQDLIDNGPKNEIYLRQNQTLVLSLSTNREVQLGLKALNASTTYTVNGGSSTDLDASTDMFYVVTKTADGTVTITNTGTGILAITKLKICDAPADAVQTLTQESVTDALTALGYVEGETEPEVPEVTYADAQLNLTVTAGSETLTTGLTANGVAGETVTFSAADIQAAVESLSLPEGYVLGEQTYTEVTVTYGESESLTFTAEEEVTEPDPDPDPEPTPDPEPSKPSNSIWNKITNAFKKLFGWF